MKTSWKEVIKQTSKSSKRDELYVSIVIKHFFNGLKLLMKNYKLFKGNGLFKTYVKKSNKNKKT
jgi:hypothetical protein